VENKKNSMTSQRCSFGNIGWLLVVYHQMSNYFSCIIVWASYTWWDYDDVHFVQDHHT